MTRPRTAALMIESLEPRNLLSGVITTAPLFTPPTTATITAAVTTTPPPTTTPISATSGIVLRLTAGQSFTGEVAFYPSPVLDPPLAYSATIDWGDGTTSKATLQYATHGNLGGYEIIGTHTYASSGNFRILSTVLESPIATNGGPVPQWIRIVSHIVSLAIVSPASSTGGVTIHEPAGTPFTTTVGSFNFPAPATGLQAAITWGDGTSSEGTLVPAGINGIDVIHLNVQGTHTYVDPGVYAIHILITKPSPTPSASAVNILLTIDSTAIIGANAVPPPIVSPITTSF